MSNCLLKAQLSQTENDILQAYNLNLECVLDSLSKRPYNSASVYLYLVEVALYDCSCVAMAHKGTTPQL